MFVDFTPTVIAGIMTYGGAALAAISLFCALIFLGTKEPGAAAAAVIVALILGVVVIAGVNWGQGIDAQNKQTLQKAAAKTYGLHLSAHKAGELLGVAGLQYAGFGAWAPVTDKTGLYGGKDAEITLSQQRFEVNGVRKLRVTTQRVHLVRSIDTGRWSIVAVAPKRTITRTLNELPQAGQPQKLTAR